jgi:hypothetical protein
VVLRVMVVLRVAVVLRVVGDAKVDALVDSSVEPTVLENIIFAKVQIKIKQFSAFKSLIFISVMISYISNILSQLLIFLLKFNNFIRSVF